MRGAAPFKKGGKGGVLVLEIAINQARHGELTGQSHCLERWSETDTVTWALTMGGGPPMTHYWESGLVFGTEG